ncbi:hypothetical protein BGW42_003087 [Actinomortierella wolfii]|nr:hypothetical protein BGW42_003087 [Actinomortierella wolfii]
MRETGASLFGIPPPSSNQVLGSESVPPPPDSLYASFQSQPPSSTGDPSSSNGETRKTWEELVANFSHVAAGFYNLLLRVKADSSTSGHLVIHTNIRYEAERGLRDTVHQELHKQKMNESGWHYLMAENQIEIRPHKNVVRINIRITRRENSDIPFEGKLWVRSIELVPVGKDPIDKNAKIYVTKVALPQFATPTNPEDKKYLVSQLAHSKDGDFVAALRLLPNEVMVHAWRKVDLVRHSTSEFSQALSAKRASFSIRWPSLTKEEGGRTVDVNDIPLGLAIADDGSQIAVYQTPYIGDWQDRDNVPTATFCFHLFQNPLFRNGNRSEYRNHTSVNVSAPSQMVTGDGHELTTINSLIKLDPPAILKHSIGYASYVGQFEKDGGGVVPPKFIFCNGYYLDVFEVNNHGLVPLHTISLEGLIPTISRRFACETTMSSITETMFLWVEEGGRYCSTWDLLNGSAIKVLEISRWRYDNLNSNSRMHIARSQNILAIAGFDNSITTIFTDSGIEISQRRFMTQRIEFLDFALYQSAELFVVLRKSSTGRISTRVLDPLRLEVEFLASTVPIPTRSTIFCRLGQSEANDDRIVCHPKGDVIEFYHLKELYAKDPKESGVRLPLPKPTVITASNGVHYQLTTRRANVEDSPIGGEEQNKRLVEIWRIADNPPTPTTARECIFSFVPEPWEQQAESWGFFLPTGDRFVVYASRTLQVWGLPTEKEPCKLLYFTSIYRKQSDDMFNKTEMEVVLSEHLRFGTVHFIICSSGTDYKRIYANIVPFESGEKVKDVHIPGIPMSRTDQRNTAENCFQNIHLLALAYSIVSSGYDETKDTGLRDTNHEMHAQAIFDFINSHINHTNYIERITNPSLHGTAVKLTKGMTAVTIWSYFRTEQYLPKLYAKLVTGILSKSNCRWIPRKHEVINPILKAIDCKKSIAVEAFIDYCVQRSADRHPAYMMPVVQCFRHLALYYPEILRNLLKKSSYIPALKSSFHKSLVTSTGIQLQPSIFRRSKREPSYLVFSHHLRFLKPSENASSRIQPFPQPHSNEAATPTAEKTRFSGLSQFSRIAGKDFFSSPAMMAVLRYKLRNEGFVDYILSPFNKLDVFSILLTMASQILVLVNCVKSPEESELEGPDRIPLVCFAVVTMYLHLLFELRVYQPIGVIVNKIVSIPSRIKWFFIIFAMMIVGFTHGLIHVLTTSKPECKPSTDGTVKNLTACTEFLRPTSYPTSFLHGLSGTLYFLAGRYEFIGSNFESTDIPFHFLMAVFYFVAALVMLNVLIADRVRHLFPDYIYYVAPIQEAETYRSQLAVREETGLTNERFSIHESNTRQISQMQAKMDMMEQQLKRMLELLEARPTGNDGGLN